MDLELKIDGFGVRVEQILREVYIEVEREGDREGKGGGGVIGGGEVVRKGRQSLQRVDEDKGFVGFLGFGFWVGGEVYEDVFV